MTWTRAVEISKICRAYLLIPKQTKYLHYIRRHPKCRGCTMNKESSESPSVEVIIDLGSWV